MVASIPTTYQSIFDITSRVYTDEDEFVDSKPSVVKDEHGNVLATTNAMIYQQDNPLDDSLIQESAYQIAVKTKNQKAVQRVLGDGKYGHSKLCQEINQVRKGCYASMFVSCAFQGCPQMLSCKIPGVSQKRSKLSIY